MTESERILAMLKKRRENFISKRSIIEQDIEKYREALEKASDKTKARMGINLADLNAKTLFPSLYIEPLNVAQYELERAAYGEMLKPILVLRKEFLTRADGLANES